MEVSTEMEVQKEKEYAQIMTIKKIAKRIIHRFSKMFQINKPVNQLDQLSSEQNCTPIRYLENKLSPQELENIDAMIYIKHQAKIKCRIEYEICQKNKEHRPTHFLIKVRTQNIQKSKTFMEIMQDHIIHGIFHGMGFDNETFMLRNLITQHPKNQQK